MDTLITTIKNLLGLGNSGWDGDAVLRRLISTLIIGLLGIVIFASTFSPLKFLLVTSTGFLLAGASSVCGSFLGFLFGIPRTNQPGESEGTETNNRDTNNSRNYYKPNTNLEQISDWLTKILVGVGLTQIEDISAGFGRIVARYSDYMEDNPAIVSTIIIYFVISGFMLGYLWSRIYMAGAIQKVEEESRMEARIVQKVQSKVDEKAQNDAKALSIVNQILSLDASIEPLPQEELNTIIAKASPVVKVTIFNQAQSFRQQYWNNPLEKAKVARVIPIFKALISNDQDAKYHRNHGQLGYALKDQENPNYVEAEAELSKAINIRDKLGKQSKWLFYEFNRAYCRIRINEIKGEEVFSREDILKDINKARKNESILKIISGDEVFTQWLQNNSH